MTGKIIGALLVLAGLLLIVYWEHAKKIAATVGGMATQVQGPSDKKKAFWTWVGIAVVVAVLWWLYSTNPSVARVSTLARENWAVVIVSAGLIIWALVHFAKTKTETALSWMAILVIAVWVAGPVTGWWERPSHPAMCADVSVGRATCLINTNTSIIKRAPWEASMADKFFCYTPVDEVEIHRRGSDEAPYWEVRAKKEEILLTYDFRNHCAP